MLKFLIELGVAYLLYLSFIFTVVSFMLVLP
jgi:hypothetical protein